MTDLPSSKTVTLKCGSFQFDKELDGRLWIANDYSGGHITSEDCEQLRQWLNGTTPDETTERLPNLVDRLKRINAINDDPSRYNREIDKLTECGKFIASDEYCELLIGHEGRCGLQPGSVRRAVEPIGSKT